MNQLSYKMQENQGLTGAAIASIIGLAIKALASYGFDLTPEAETLIMAVAWLLFPIIGAYVARMYTTPLIRPRDNDGNALTPDVPLPNVP